MDHGKPGCELYKCRNDFYPRDGKVGGAFCAGVEALGESRILTNFYGQFGDAVTLAHELGHAFHNQCIRDHRPLNRDYSMPVAETASTFNECVVMAAAMGEDPEEVFKTLVTQGRSERYYVFVVPVDRELDLKKAAASVGEKSVEMIRSKDLLPTTGYVHGGCSPLGYEDSTR